MNDWWILPSYPILIINLNWNVFKNKTKKIPTSQGDLIYFLIMSFVQIFTKFYTIHGIPKKLRKYTFFFNCFVSSIKQIDLSSTLARSVESCLACSTVAFPEICIQCIALLSDSANVQKYRCLKPNKQLPPHIKTSSRTVHISFTLSIQCT